MGLTATEPKNADFYDRWTELFLRGFGPVFQAGILTTGDPPREDIERSIVALAERAGILDGDRILDAGCGVGGPASIIARHYPDVRIDAITNSRAQARIAVRELARAGSAERVMVRVADYQHLPYPDAVFDVVVFFESTGYADDVSRLYAEAARVVKPGGRVYVKDVFCRTGALTSAEAAQLEAFDALWGCVRTKTTSETADAMEAAGLDVVRAGVIEGVGTATLAGSMFTFDCEGELTATELGEDFAVKDLHPPVEFAEVLAIKPG